MSDDARRVGSNIRYLREELGISQSALAESMREGGQDHWRQTTVSRVERGTQELSVGELLALERVFGPGTIFGTTTDETLQMMGVGIERGVTLRHLRKVAAALEESQELVQYLRQMYSDPELEDDGVDPEA